VGKPVEPTVMGTVAVLTSLSWGPMAEVQEDIEIPSLTANVLMPLEASGSLLDHLDDASHAHGGEAR
jgi:hypothetical protein